MHIDTICELVSFYCCWINA